MTIKCDLKTEGYKVVFSIISRDVTLQRVEMDIQLSLNEEFGGFTIPSTRETYYLRDLKLLPEYLETHLDNLSQGKNDASYTFGLYEATFSLQAQTGRIEDDGQGRFALEFMINVNPEDHLSPVFL